MTKAADGRRRRRSKSGLAMAAAGAFMAAQGAEAQTTQTNLPPSVAGATNQTEKLPDVVVKGRQEADSYKPESLSSPKFTVPLLDVPQSVTVVPKAVMEEQNATTLRDVLRNVSGISMQAGEGGVPAGDNLSVRGFNARTDFFIDGVRDIGGYTRDPFNLEQVEVVKGPSSAYGGRGSTGGSINLVTKSPTLAPSYGGSYGIGTQEYQRVTVDLNQPIPQSPVEGTAVRLNGLWTQSEVAGRNVTSNERWGVAPSLTLGLGTPTRITMTYLHLSQDNQPDYGIPWVPAGNVPLAAYVDQPAPVDYENYYGLKSRDFERVETDIPSVKVEHEFSDTLSLRNLSRYGQNVRDSVITAPRFASTTSTDLNRQLQSRDQTDRIFSNQTDLRIQHEGEHFENTLTPGVEFNYETSLNYARAASTATPLADLYHPNPDAAFNGVIRRTGAFTEAAGKSAAVYAFDTLKMGEHWEVSGGLRWDYFALGYDSTATNSVVTSLGRVDKTVSWRGGLVYKPVKNGSIYGAVGSSFNPAAEGLSLSSAANAAANVNTDPEESTTYEIGSKWEFFQNRLSLGAAIFRTDKSNARTEDPADATDIIVLEGEQRVDGVEFNAGGSITKNWKVFGGYTLLLSEIVSSKNPLEVGKQLSNTPEHSFSLWTTVDLPLNFQVGFGGQYVGSRFARNDETREAPDYLLFDTMAAYRINEHFTLRLNVNNLTDERYIDRVGGGHVVPGAGRSAFLAASVKF